MRAQNFALRHEILDRFPDFSPSSSFAKMELPVFFGKKIKYQHPCVWSPLKNDSLELYELHVSQLALGPTAKGKHILVCKVSGEDGESESMVLATLSHDTNIPQMSVRLSFTEHVSKAQVDVRSCSQMNVKVRSCCVY